MDDRNSTSEFDWDDARVFLAAYRETSLLGAAKILGVSHSTVRRRLAGLEKSIGTSLFSATSDGLIPTDAAEAAYSVAEQVEAAAAAFGGRLTGDARELEGSLVLTTLDGLSEFVAPIITRFVQSYPKIEITLNTENRKLDLARREADVALRLTDTPDERLFGRRVGKVRYAAFAAPDLVERHGTAISELPWILWSEASGAVGTEAWYAEQSGGKTPVARITNAMALISLIKAGVGGGVLPLPMVHQANLIQLSEPIASFATDLWCLCHNDLRHSERVRKFMDHVVDGAVEI